MNDFIQKIKTINNKFYLIMGIVFLVVTGGMNLYGYFHLPDNIATQFSFSGGSVNHMDKPYYLALTSVLVLVSTILFLHSEKERKLKYFFVDGLIVIANIVMIAVQLN